MSEVSEIEKCAVAFVHESENWEAYTESKGSNSVAWPPEFLLLAQAVAEKYGSPHRLVHNGVTYDGDYSDSIPVAEYVKDDVLIDRRAPTYRLKLSKGHTGPDIEVLMVNPHDEDDGEGGRDFVWDKLLWADDQSPFENDYLVDVYTDPLRDEFREIARNWTS